MTKLYSCTILPEVFRDIDDPPKFGVRDHENGLIGAFWNKKDQQLHIAAPDLLDALLQFEAHYPHGINPWLDEAWNKARAAIAKAEGRDQ